MAQIFQPKLHSFGQRVGAGQDHREALLKEFLRCEFERDRGPV